MRNLYDYFYNKINFYFESIESDSYRVNQFYMLKELQTKDQLKKILEDNDDLTLFTKLEFDVFKKHRRNLLDSFINKFNFEDTGYLYLLKGTTNKLNENYVMTLERNRYGFTYNFEPAYFKANQGIVFLKEKRESFKDKKYKQLSDLKNDSNIGLYVKKIGSDKIKIICYDYSYFNEFFSEKNDFIFPILFQGQISNNKDTKDLSYQRIPYDGGVINWTVARKDVSGRKILYPILAHYANNNILIADRDSLSSAAKKVWTDFYTNNDIFNEKMPIDNWQYPITLNNIEDDGRLYSDTPPIKLDYKKIREMDPQEQKDELIRIRRDDPYNWAYKLNDSIKSNIIQTIKELQKNHEKISSKESNDFLIKLESISNDFFDKNIR